MNESQQPHKSWRKLAPCGCLLAMLLACITLPLIGWMVWSNYAAGAVEQELAKIRAASEPLEPADLDTFYAVPPGKSDATLCWAAATRTFEDTSFSEAAREFPVVGLGPEVPPIGEDWEQLEAVDDFLATYQDEMAQIHEAAKLGGYARFDREFEEGIAMLLPQVQGLRGCARMLTLEARVAGHHGDADAVARSIHAIFATCRAVEEDPILVSHLVRVALAGIAVGELEVASGAVDFSDADLQMLREDVRSVDFQHSLERSLLGERVTGILTFRNPGQFAAQEGVSLPVRADNEDLALYLSTFDKYLKASRTPFPQALTLSEQATQELQQAAGGSQVNRLRYVFTNLLLPAVDAVFEATARGTGALACADVSLAIEQYRRTKGQLPTTLAELVPEFLDAIPLDPMDEKPLRYLVNDGGYVLYSVGRNRVDDGGVMGDERLDEVYSVRIRAMDPPAKANE